MVIPVGPPGAQHVIKAVKRRSADGSVSVVRSDIYGGAIVPFVPFTGSHSVMSAGLTASRAPAHSSRAAVRLRCASGVAVPVMIKVFIFAPLRRTSAVIPSTVRAVSGVHDRMSIG